MLKSSCFLILICVVLNCSSANAQKARILYLGDSLSMGAFGKSLDSGLRKQGAEVFTVIAGGASPYYWLKAYQSLPSTIGYWEKTPTSERRVNYIRSVPKLEDMLEDYQPDFVIVQTGINLYATLRSRRRPKDENVLQVRSLIDQMCHSISKAGAEGYWILPPHSHEGRYSSELQAELAGIMRDVVKEYRGAVFESREVTRYTAPYPANDGIHYGESEARDWAARVQADLSVFVHERKTSPRTEPVLYSRKIPRARVIVGTSLDPGPGLGNAPNSPEVPGATVPALPNLNPGQIKVLDMVDLDLKLLAKSEVKSLDYKNALGVFEYEVIRDRIGNYPYERIRVAHGVVFGKKFTGAAKRKIGSTIALRLVPLASYRTLKSWQLVDDLPPNFEMPIYTPRLD